MMNHEFDLDTELVDYLTIIKNIENIGQILPNILHGSMHYKIGVTCVLYENIDQILPNKLHGPMHYKIGVTCVYNGHVIYTLL